MSGRVSELVSQRVSQSGSLIFFFFLWPHLKQKLWQFHFGSNVSVMTIATTENKMLSCISPGLSAVRSVLQ